MKEDRTIFIDWEEIGGNSYRLRVFGGWIVKSKSSNTNWIKGSGDQTTTSISTVFVPDSKHEWLVGNEEYGYEKFYVVKDESQ